MGSLSGFHFLVIAVVAVVLIVPFWKIFPRAGWSSWMAIFMAVPFLNIILVWTLAFKKWPDDKGF